MICLINLLNTANYIRVKLRSDKNDKIKNLLHFLKNKAKTLEDIFNNGQYIIVDEVNFNQEDIKLIDDKAKKIISDFMTQFSLKIQQRDIRANSK